MRKRYLLFGIMSISLIIAACSSQTNEQTAGKTGENDYIGKPTAKDILTNNEDADIFMLNGIVYSNAEEIEWVAKQELTLGKEIGKIKRQSKEGSEFENYTATKLPVGTIIYEPVEKGDIYIVLIDNKQMRYLGLREG